MRKRFAILWVLLPGLVLLPACRKSGESESPNFFGASPAVSQVSITKKRPHFNCSTATALCCVDPPTCTCCCIPDTVNAVVADIDLMEVSASVTDADGAVDLLVVLLRFLDPPKDGTPPGTQLSQISLELFDVGNAPVGQQVFGTGLLPILSGDQVSGDGVYSRKFYFRSNLLTSPEACIAETNFQALGGTYSTYSTATPFGSAGSRNFEFNIEAVDRAGNITPSNGIVFPISESQATLQQNPRPCGGPSGNGGCFPSTP